MQSRIRKFVLRHEDDPVVEPAVEPSVEPKTFEAITSQEDFDRRVRDRLARQKAQFADYEDVKAKAAKYDEAELANKSELEKATARAEAAERAATENAARAAETALRAEIIAAASKAKIADPADAVALIDRALITAGDDGITGVDEAIAALVASKPYLLAAGDGRPAGSIDQGGKGGSEPVDFRSASREDANAEIARLGGRRI